ncbi:MAG: threonine synthase [Verrucomicrobiales bacterium]
MRFVSTRNERESATFFEAFANGLAPDGGLYVPEELPDLNPETVSGEAQPYPALAVEILELFDTDHTPDQVFKLVDKSYSNFTDMATAPLRQLDDKLYVLELFHGPSLAFKDFGLQLVGNLFDDQIRRTGNSINVLGATSGDTGAAAIASLAGKEGVSVFILYPKGRISDMQERQMTCTGASNIFPIPIEGTFDDCQRLVKTMFMDEEFRNQVRLSSINSINLARVLAQSIYYVHAFTQLPAEKSEQVEFVVPTGNFGNVFAGWMAAKMGVPASRFKVATNRNDILHRLFSTGVYEEHHTVSPSFAPSMDIQVASNFERFLYYSVGGDGGQVKSIMSRIRDTGRIEIPNFSPDTFRSTRSSDEDIIANIKKVYETYDYVVDPHTACGFQEIDPEYTSVVLATAHPAKFPSTIQKAIGIHPKHPTLEKLREKQQVRYELDPDVDEIRAFMLLNGVM